MEYNHTVMWVDGIGYVANSELVTYYLFSSRAAWSLAVKRSSRL